MPFVIHATEVEYVRRMRDMLCTDISSESNVVNLFHCCLPRTFCFFTSMREMDTWGRDMNLEAGQRS